MFLCFLRLKTWSDVGSAFLKGPSIFVVHGGWSWGYCSTAYCMVFRDVCSWCTFLFIRFSIP